MVKKPTYEELEQRVKVLENEAFEHKRIRQDLRDGQDFVLSFNLGRDHQGEGLK